MRQDECTLPIEIPMLTDTGELILIAILGIRGPEIRVRGKPGEMRQHSRTQSIREFDTSSSNSSDIHDNISCVLIKFMIQAWNGRETSCHLGPGMVIPAAGLASIVLRTLLRK